MITILMEILAIVVGLIFGYYIGLKAADFTLTLMYLAKYRREEAYLGLYDLLDDERGYKLTKDHAKPMDSYHAYLKLHRDARDKAYGLFRAYYSDLTKYVARYVLLIGLVAIVLWHYWAFALAASIVAILCFLAYKRFVKHRDVDFYARLMMSAVLCDFSSQKH
jgi:hypothetical protein